MDEQIVKGKNVSNKYLDNREKLLKYTYIDMGLTLENDQQVYLALFDMPIESGIAGFQTQSLALVYGLNTHIYHGSGTFVVGLEEYPEVKKAMQSVLISSHQALLQMNLISNPEFYNSKHARVYLKTREGIYFKELNEGSQIDKFLMMLMHCVMTEISETGKLDIKE